MHSYFALVWPPDNPSCATEVATIEAALVAAPKPWVVAYKNSGVTVIHQPSGLRFANVHLLANGNGVVLGSLFRRSRLADTAHSAVAHLDASESTSILHSRGRHLVSQYWGSYVAIVHDRQAEFSSVLRDPTANLPCYHTKWGAIDIFFSELEEFSRYIPRRLSVSWPHIAARLLAGTQLSRDCGLREIEDVPGGEWISLSRQGESRTVIWHPAQFCLDDLLEDEEKAAQELKTTVVNVVHSLAAQHSDILIRLSGGLDSSIVATCVGQKEDRPNVTCMNYYVQPDNGGEANGPNPVGLNKENLAKFRRVIGSADEREFARSVARKCKFRLIETERRVRDLDFRQVGTAPSTPRPSNYLFFLTEDRAEMECVADTNATACFTGEGGDTVFYCTLRAIGALDYAYVHPFGARLLYHVGVTAALSGESFAHVLSKVAKHGFLRVTLPGPYESMKRPHLMTAEATSAISRKYFHHPWLDIAPRLCPGKQNHVAGIATSALFYHYVQHRERNAPSVRPLASQPVVETCLRIPSYILLADGISRGLARRAFRDFLPPEVARRTVKGLTMGFWQTAVRRNMQFIRQYLLDGLLVKKGLLDRRKLEAYLIDDQPWLTVGADQIMDYLGCEAWVSRWTLE